MLNEKKIRLMTRTAIYEKHEGKEDLKINEYCSGDYVRFNMLKTLIGVTISALLLSGLYVMITSEDIFQVIFKIDLKALARLLLTAYFLALVVYIIVSVLYYQIRYSRAKKRLKHYNRNLTLIAKYSKGQSVETAGGNEEDE